MMFLQIYVYAYKYNAQYIIMKMEMEIEMAKQGQILCHSAKTIFFRSSVRSYSFIL